MNLIRIDPAAGRTLSSQVAAGLRHAILEGALRPGDRLPATRLLATELSVARSTIVEAFEQLVSEGLVQARVGSGSYVNDLPLDADGLPRARALKPGPDQADRMARMFRMANQQLVRRVDHPSRPFTTAMPALDAFPMAQWTRLMNRQWQEDRSAHMGYGDPLGWQPLRQAVARHLRGNRGVDCDPAQVFITAGAQQGFQLAAALLLGPGDRVWFEDPGAIGARNSFVAQGAEVIPVPVDHDGLSTVEGLRRAPDFRLAFVTPAHQHPLGARMSHDRRLALLTAADHADAFVLEDDWDGDLFLAGRSQPALKAFDTGDRVIYAGSFSKTMFPALRLGFLVAPLSLVAGFEAALRACSPGVPTSLQAAMAGFIDEGLYAAHIRRMRRLYAERQDALIAATACLSPLMRLVPTQTGLQTLGWLHPGLDAETVAVEAEAAGISVLPLSRFCIERREDEAILLGFAGTPVPRIVQGARQLGDIITRLAQQSGLPNS